MTRGVVSRGTAEHYTWGGACDGWHLVRRAETSVILERMPPGAAEVRHYHRVSWQFFFVLAGTATLEMNGEVHTIQAHQGLEVPPRVPHQMRNKSAVDVEFLVISQPASRGDRALS